MRFNEKFVGLALILLGAVALLAGWRMQPSKSLVASVSPRQMQSEQQNLQPVVSDASGRVACQVLTVYDGDTLGCDLDQDGNIERPEEEIRLLGIDSPEMHYSRKNPTYGTEHPRDEPFAQAASQWMTRQVDHKTIYLEFDQRRRDRYRRTLAFVYLNSTDTVSVNEQELAQGLATLLFIGKNRLHEEQFQAVETKARNAKQGLWSNTLDLKSPLSGLATTK
jgi:micrococcal nuclease